MNKRKQSQNNQNKEITGNECECEARHQRSTSRAASTVPIRQTPECDCGGVSTLNQRAPDCNRQARGGECRMRQAPERECVGYPIITRQAPDCIRQAPGKCGMRQAPYLFSKHRNATTAGYPTINRQAPDVSGKHLVEKERYAANTAPIRQAPEYGGVSHYARVLARGKRQAPPPYRQALLVGGQRNRQRTVNKRIKRDADLRPPHNRGGGVMQPASAEISG